MTARDTAPCSGENILSPGTLAEGRRGDTEKAFEAVGEVITVAHMTGFRDIFQAEIGVQEHLFSLTEKKLFAVFPRGTPHLFPENLEKQGDTHAAFFGNFSDFIIPLARQELNDMPDPVMSSFYSGLTFAGKTLGFSKPEEAPDAFIRFLFKSPCDTVIIPMQDVLGLDGSARMNYPGTIGGNWLWRMKPDMLSLDLSMKYYRLNKETNSDLLQLDLSGFENGCTGLK